MLDFVSAVLSLIRFGIFRAEFIEELVGTTDRVNLAKWVQKRKRGKAQERLLVIGDYRVYSIRKGGLVGGMQVRET